MVRIKDIAQLAQVSDAAASRVLNGDANFSVSEPTRQRILAAAAELGYKPSRMRKVKDQESSRRFQIGLLMSVSQVDEVNDPYYLSIRLGMKNSA
jgi:LacI family transcriptional regulator